MQIQYQTQRLSMRFFMLMAVLFIIQVGFGLLLAMQHVDPTLLAGTLNFNIARAEHLNLGILWILAGFIGTILFVGPLMSKRELAAPALIKFLFYALCAVTIWNFISQGFAADGVAGWWMGQPWIQEGLEYLEAGRAADVVILIGFSILAYVVWRTFPPRKDWNEIHWGLAIGVLALTFVWLFGMFFVERQDLSEYFRWYVVHYWVEGVWEVIHISLIGFLLVLLFDANVKSVGYAVFWGVVLVWLSGLIGNAHHYFWIGTPEFWQFWGSLFSALEPLPLVFCFWHIYLDAHHDRKPLKNAPAFYFILGSVVLEQVGAGILGFTMTFALTNVWSHGTWITPAHGHLALFGTFGMLGIAAAYFAVPVMRGIKEFDQRLGKTAFWLVFTGMLGIAFAFAMGGTAQIFIYRTLSLDWFGGDVYPAMNFFKALVPVFGAVFLFGTGIIVYDLMTMGKRAPAQSTAAAPDVHAGPLAVAHAPGRWSRYLEGYEAGLWLMGMWIFGAIITFGLLSFNLASVRAGDPTLPYILAWIGYPGLLLITLLFVWRFLASLDARAKDPANVALPQVLAQPA
ncbi:cbb3-type cytochrome c oxidase subunit I [Thermomonas sp.]|uniref:cbb3-type cytochrome c oxidase subunit I n=1 Tax=Thermomonas sp. TaxID=1971895 RepID=UPI0026232AE8|nr:cbb3-type cytochrome c oxidase subunit I [Thermomonas sp.]MCO5054725.1 cbb3-type cytochrome c oxidase subunit I [Thermomonas sp.]